MNGVGTVVGAEEYWRRYYAEEFRFGLGTEDILATLMQVPRVDRWADLGCGSESMLWAIGLRARKLVAVDADPQRLEILRQFTATRRPRGVHTTALRLCGRTHPDDFTRRCRSLTALVPADCLSGRLPTDPNWVSRHREGRVELTEQLYRHAATHAGVRLLLLNRIHSADPEFPAVWTYVGQTGRTPDAPRHTNR